MFIANEVDPAGRELRALREALDDVLDLSVARVLEIGCGAGRLSFRYARRAASVLAIDPDVEQLREANAERPADVGDRLHFVAAGATRLPFRQAGFDVVLFAWSL